MSPKLTTHVLDTNTGKPASGVSIELFYQDSLVSQATTGTDGRCDAPLLSGDSFLPGTYELLFHIGDYFRSHGVPSPFLGSVPVRFTAEPGCNTHVPLVCSPYAYSTYRGS